MAVTPELTDPVAPELGDTVAIVLAGGQGTRLFELTGRDCKPALPFARFHRIVDFTMAALARSGVGRVMVGTQYRPESLTAHLHEVWAPVWPNGGLMLRDGAAAGPAGYRGTADVLRANAAELDAMGAREVLVVAADHVYSMDYRGFIEAHRERGAKLTLAAMPVPREEAGRFGIVTEGPGHRIAGFAEKPAKPAAIHGDTKQSLASLGIYVIDWPWLREMLADPKVLDFGEDVIPQAVHGGEAAVWRWDGYWRDVGTLDGLRESWLDFEEGPPPCRRPLVPGMKVRMQAATLPRDAFTSSVNLGGLRLMSPMIGSGNPDRWTALDRSVLMPGARVSPGVRLTNVIVAPNTVIPHGMHIGDDPTEDARWFRVSGETTLVNSAMLARRGASRAPVFSLFHGGPTLPRKAQRAQ
ncbi:MAG: sugar phosphate nucleotidyltransferase [Tabrizicola sp.]|uniref:glucose-1-phosphate adenylyltransferase family protein n=1 Tax=Tabrizicola sp. TaxID=2005166 RepID=UPI002AB8C2FC|nr:sugar phosphate nucleotidyltransferase [Tabrizicola sp.]MDZ4087740.1 sugar phosphate nucleotidyltransferase [Tabrizicola sp.]